MFLLASPAYAKTVYGGDFVLRLIVTDKLDFKRIVEHQGYDSTWCYHICLTRAGVRYAVSIWVNCYKVTCLIVQDNAVFPVQILVKILIFNMIFPPTAQQ